MEEKYCERCGVYLGVVRADKKYCESCAKALRNERSRKGIRRKKEIVTCAFCGKPLEQISVTQKYHRECSHPAHLKIMRERKKDYIKKPVPVNKKRDNTTKKILSVEQVQRLADKAGISYAMASLKLATGELTYEW